MFVIHAQPSPSGRPPTEAFKNVAVIDFDEAVGTRGHFCNVARAATTA